MKIKDARQILADTPLTDEEVQRLGFMDAEHYRVVCDKVIELIGACQRVDGSMMFGTLYSMVYTQMSVLAKLVIGEEITEAGKLDARKKFVRQMMSGVVQSAGGTMVGLDLETEAKPASEPVKIEVKKNETLH